MQSWVYLTPPEVKHTQEPVNQLPTNLLCVCPTGKKKCTFLFSYIPPNAPQNSLENWKHPKRCLVPTDNSVQTHSYHPRL